MRPYNRPSLLLRVLPVQHNGLPAPLHHLGGLVFCRSRSIKRKAVSREERVLKRSRVQGPLFARVARLPHREALNRKIISHDGEAKLFAMLCLLFKRIARPVFILHRYNDLPNSSRNLSFHPFALAIDRLHPHDWAHPSAKYGNQPALNTAFVGLKGHNPTPEMA